MVGWNIFIDKAHCADGDIIAYMQIITDDAAVGADFDIITDIDFPRLIVLLYADSHILSDIQIITYDAVPGDHNTDIVGDTEPLTDLTAKLDIEAVFIPQASTDAYRRFLAVPLRCK